MPLAVYVLGMAIFAQGTSELMLAGLLPGMAHDLGVSVPAAGWLISAFAIGMLAGAPPLAVLTLRWPHRRAMLAFLAVFALTHVVSALTPGYWTLFAMRIVGAIVYAGFWAVAAATAVNLVPRDARGKAMGVVAGGLTVAAIVGLPAGTVVGQHLGWRAAFWAVAAMSAAAMAGVVATIPAARPDAAPPRVRDEVRAMAVPRLWLLYGTTAVATSGLLAVFGYLGAFLTETTGIAEAWVPGVLALYGAGALIGITLGGRTADRWGVQTLYAGFAGLTVVSVLLALTARSPLPVVVLVFLLGFVGFGTNPTLNSRAFGLVDGASTLVAAGNVVAFNIGITVGPWLGGLAIGAGRGYPSTAWIGAALGAAAIGTVAIGARTRGGARRRSAGEAEPARSTISA
ncbi:DHA1 family chloramphenicol resistance protein-like MFS transporter [Actinomadura luteofluorescens]|uniref:DHA1 family chloramphenicol resistance protein-like MFS transporter n=1 Tax=Actinomadura luteofluorescens TaxID=46163 RepID=A0A7Y9JFK6_9ACTN|nr:Cmx/CmrA family chloramphenicol efflux MFS transporter [Actinomadura luteofluorescens]NYD46626.1 DHA1 family chloramphenicol resistance protein-like MFS transporter [Actinomadura luteofluorescens]